MMTIVVCNKDKTETLVFPIVPDGMELDCPAGNEEFKTANAGTLNLIGDLGLRTLNISSVFLKEQRKWQAAGSTVASDYVKFFDKYMKKKVPVRLIATFKDGSEWFNILCTVEDFKYHYDRGENVWYSLDFKEYTAVV